MAKKQRDERLEADGPTANGASEPSAAPEGATPEEAAPKRRATRSRRKAEDAAEAPPAETAAEAPQEEAKPARRRSRARKAEEPAAEAQAEEAPKRRRTRRKADDDAEAPPAEAPPAPAPPAEAASEAPQREARPAPRAQEPRQPDQRREERRPDDRRSDDRPDQGQGKRKRGRKNKNKQGGGQPQGHQAHQQHQGHQQQQGQGQANGNNGGHPGKEFRGMVEMIGDKNFGFIREVHPSLPKGDNDAFMPPPLIDKYHIRDGVIIEGVIKPGRKGAWQVTDVHKVMDVDPEEWKGFTSYDEGVTIYPNEKLNLVTGPADVSMRVVDLVAPLGKGQRALIVAPPRAGKTIILKQLARSLAQNHPEVQLVALLIDERPEEVTDFRRNTEAMVFASSNDYQEDNHIRVATLAFEHCRRMVEMGKDVVLLLDSLTRLGRTFNLWGGNSGRTMSGGLDARALLMPRKIFGAARNIEHGGSLTIVATALIETGSRMDDVIFEEFKGTGNAEIVLDRELADKRIYPAINLRKSGTRNIEQLLGMEMLQYHNVLMRALNSRHPVEAMQALIRHIMSSPDNVHLMNELIPSEI